MLLKKIPPVWLIVIIVGIPQLSETVYTPSLPDLAEFFKVSHAAAEYTLTIYLFSFAYYCLISLITLVIGVLHNGTLFVMPFYFLSLSVLMLMVYKVYNRN